MKISPGFILLQLIAAAMAQGEVQIIHVQRQKETSVYKLVSPLHCEVV